MIRIENLTFTYPGASNATLNQIDLKIEKGDFLAVIGNNGCGKSTLCKVLNGLIPHFITGDLSGNVIIEEMDTKEHTVGEIAKKIGYVYQDFENQIVRPTVLDDASFACLNYAMKDYKLRGVNALAMCGLEHKQADFIWQLSGGQKHLLALAGALALSPDVLILDEPIAQLDPEHARQTYEILKNLNEVYGKTIIVIEHHTEYIANYCKHAVLMKEGRLVWKLPAKEGLRRVTDLVESKIFPPQIAVAATKLQELGILSDEITLPTTVEEGRAVFDTLSFFPQRKKTQHRLSREDDAISFQKVSVSYKAVKGEAISILQDFSLDIKKGEKIALIGSNGAGKSTLLKLMIGLIKPYTGQIFLSGNQTNQMTAEELSKLISLIFQNPEEMFIKDSIERDIAYAMQVRQVTDWKVRTEELLELFHLTQLKERDGRLLSGGQMRRASLAVGIALNPGILLMDEPTANLDIATRHEIMMTLDRLKEVTETVVIATHDMQLVCQWADRILVLHQGKLIADGNKEEIFSDEALTSLVGIRPPEIYAMGKQLSTTANCYTIEDFVECFEEVSYESKIG